MFKHVQNPKVVAAVAFGLGYYLGRRYNVTVKFETVEVQR